MRSVTHIQKSGVASLHGTPTDAQIKKLQAFADKLKWPKRDEREHRLHSRATVTLGAVNFDGIRVLCVNSGSGCGDSKCMTALAQRYSRVEQVAVDAAPASTVCLVDFKQCREITVICADPAGGVQVTPPGSTLALRLSNGVALAKVQQQQPIPPGFSVTLLDGALPSAANIPGAGALMVKWAGPTTPALQSEVQRIITEGTHRQLLLIAPTHRNVPWKHISEVKHAKARPIELGLSGCLSASTGFLSSRTFDALDYTQLRRLSISIDALPGMTMRLNELIQTLSNTAFALENLVIRLAPTARLPSALIPIYVSALLARHTESVRRSGAGDAKALTVNTRMEIAYSDNEQYEAAKTEVTNLMSIFARPAAPDRKEHLHSLALSSKNTSQLRAYLNMKAAIKTTKASHEKLQLALDANVYVVASVKTAIDAIFADPENEVGAYVHTKTDEFGTFAVYNHTLRVAIT